MAGKNIQLKVETQRENSFITQDDYQDIFWNFFHVSQTAIAFSNKAGKILFCNDEFKLRLVAAGNEIDLTPFVNIETPGKRLNDDVIEITFDTMSPISRLCRMELHNHPGGAAYLWFSNSGVESHQSHQVSVIKNLYHSFVDNSFELVFRTGESGNVLFFNKNFITSFEFSSSIQTRGFLFCDLLENPHAWNELKERILSEKQLLKETIRFKTLSGKSLTGLVNCHQQKDENGKLVFNWTVLDISDRVQFEESLQQKNAQLAKLNAQMEKFLYSTSHDLRSPLTSIFGLVNLLRMELNDKDILEYVSRIESSTLKLDKIIRDIMSFSKTTYQNVNSESIDFKKLFSKVIKAYESDANFGLIEFEVNNTTEIPFFSDPERLEIIIDALVRNCIHFVDSNKIRSFVRISISVNDDKGIVEIMDNGIGIARPHLEQIFNMFYKASLQSRGAGLGLYIVKEGIEQLNGTISVDSEVGFGSIFRLQLPNKPMETVLPGINEC